jgi:hypothetical protein
MENLFGVVPNEIFEIEILPYLSDATQFVLSKVNSSFQERLRYSGLLSAPLQEYIRFDSLDLVRWDLEGPSPTTMDIVKCLITSGIYNSRNSFNYLIGKYKLPAYSSALGDGMSTCSDLEIVKTVLERIPQFDDTKFLWGAIVEGHLEVVRYIVEIRNVVLNEDYLDLCHRTKSLEVLQYVAKAVNYKFSGVFFQRLGFNPHSTLEWLTWAVANGVSLTHGDAMVPYFSIYECALISGNLGALVFGKMHKLHMPRHIFSSAIIYPMTAKLEIVKWLVAEGCDVGKLPMKTWVVFARCGRLDFINYAFSLRLSLDLSQLYFAACESESLEMVLLIETKISQLDPEKTLELPSPQKLFIVAGSGSNTQILIHLLDTKPNDFKFNPEGLHDVIMTAVRNGRIHNLKFLHTRFPYSFVPRFGIIEAAIFHRHFLVLRYLHEELGWNLRTGNEFKKTVHSGSILILKYLFDLYGLPNDEKSRRYVKSQGHRIDPIVIAFLNRNVWRALTVNRKEKVSSKH